MKSYEIKNVTRMYELAPNPNPNQNQKSFYGKAKVYFAEDGTQYLVSYDEVICKKSINGHITRIWSGSTQTTSKHIFAFCGLKKREYEVLPFEN